jgi:hypothetical protein
MPGLCVLSDATERCCLGRYADARWNNEADRCRCGAWYPHWRSDCLGVVVPGFERRPLERCHYNALGSNADQVGVDALMVFRALHSDLGSVVAEPPHLGALKLEQRRALPSLIAAMSASSLYWPSGDFM